jgi:hypothetical protein
LSGIRLRNKQLKKVTNQLALKKSDYVASIVSAIPFAGGTIATLITTQSANIQHEKICSALEELSSRVDAHSINVEDVLNEEQAIELIGKTVTEIGKTADKEKIRCLKKMLIYGCCDSSVDFEEKELHLNTLIGLAIWEIKLLNYVYSGSDPFEIREYPNEQKDCGNMAGHGIATGIQFNLGGCLSYGTSKTEYREGKESLQDKLVANFGKKYQGLILGTIAKLDGKGLINMKNNLHKKTEKVLTMDKNHIGILLGGASNLKPSQTPIEGSKTDFGKFFFDSIR